jgi:hypothetical protein
MRPVDTTLTKADTVALWHAIQWMETVLRNWRTDDFLDDSRPQYDKQRELLVKAKRALRKVNAIRKAQSCRPTENLQEQQQAAGGAEA